LSWKRLSFCSSLLKASGFEKDAAGYSLFNWSELNMRITSYLYGGATLQLSSSGRMVISLEPGVQVGLMFKNWVFPVYVFDRPGTRTYFAAGACYEWKK
jgi:hypothetical protein